MASGLAADSLSKITLIGAVGAAPDGLQRGQGVVAPFARPGDAGHLITGLGVAAL
jgi:hypothetical protein